MTIILGALVSVIAQFLKNHFKTSEYATLGIVVFLAFIAAVGYEVINHYGLWNAFAAVLVLAGAFYTFILQRFESDGALPLGTQTDNTSK